MAKPRELRRRIRSVQNTRKITRTMELVATSKLKRAQDRVVAARPYAEALRQVLTDLATGELAQQFSLLKTPAPPAKGGPRTAAVILVTSNRGLAPRSGSQLSLQPRTRGDSGEAAPALRSPHGVSGAGGDGGGGAGGPANGHEECHRQRRRAHSVSHPDLQPAAPGGDYPGD